MDFAIVDVQEGDLASFIRWYHSDHDWLTVECWIESIQDQLKNEGVENAWHARQLMFNHSPIAGAYLLIYPGRLGVLNGPKFHTPVGMGNRQGKESCLDLIVPMIQGLLQTAKGCGAQMIQAIIERSDPNPPLLRQIGLEFVAHLQQWECEMSRTMDAKLFGPTPWKIPEETTITWVKYTASHAELWLQILERSYENSKDCPKMNGLRQVKDTWVGYSASAKHDLSEWWLAYCDGEPCGCVMLTMMTQDTLELTYMALLPEFRGRKLSHQLMQHIHSRCQARSIQKVVLSVDMDNTLAVQAYHRYGFQPTRMMDAWLWTGEHKIG